MNITRCKRGTGRTHNMISAAVSYAADCGSAVVVMADDKELQLALQNYCRTPEFEEWRSICNIKMSSNARDAKLRLHNMQTAEIFTITFVSAKALGSGIEWYQFRVVGTSQKETFFDHHAIELKFAEALDRWSKYDHPANKASCKAAQEHFDRERQQIEPS